MESRSATPCAAFDPAAYLKDLASECARQGVALRSILELDDLYLPVLEVGSPLSPAIHLSAGIHGDEPAGPWAILEGLCEGLFSRAGHWVIYPLLNPTGFLTSARENKSGIDINRDYLRPQSAEAQAHIADLSARPAHCFTTSLSLHEDWETRGAYLYEHNPKKTASPGPALLAVLDQHFGLEPAAEIDGWPVSAPGLIHPPSDAEFRDPWPEQIFLLSRYTSQSYTVETPSAIPLPQRVSGQLACLRSMTSFLLELSSLDCGGLTPL